MLTHLALAGSLFTVDADPAAGADFTTLQDAFLLVPEGSTLLVASGDYAAFDLDNRDLAIVAEPGADVRILGGSVVRNLARGQELCLRGLEFVAEGEHALRVLDAYGRLWLEQCTLRAAPEAGGPGDIHSGLYASLADDLRLIGCELYGARGTDELPSACATQGGAALRLEQGELLLVDCELEGGDAGHALGPFCLDALDGAAALSLSASSARIWGSRLQAGAGGDAQSIDTPFGPSCGQAGDGGSALWIAPSPAPERVELWSSDLLAGSGGQAAPHPDCAALSGSAGLPIEGLPTDLLSEIQAPLRLHWTESPVQEGASAALHLQTQAGDLGLIALGTPTQGYELAGTAGQLHLAPGFLTVFVAPLTPGGTQTFSLPIPPQAAGFGTARAYSQGAVLSSQLELFLLAPATLIVIDG